MRVHIIGAGAVGMLVASYLSKSQLEVVLVTRTQQQATLINTQKLKLIMPDGERQRLPVRATNTLKIEQGDVVIVAVKYHHLHSVYKQLRLFSQLPIIFIQNGLAHYEEALQLPHANILFGSAQFGASKLDDTTVAHRGVGVLKIAEGRGKLSTVECLFSAHCSQFPMLMVEGAERMLLEKALLNCFINPLTAILQVKNGELITNAYAYALLQKLYEELMIAFPTMQVQFPFEMVRELCERTALNTSSMLADRLAGRTTEAESIVGAVLARAACPVPTLQFLYQLLLAIDAEKRPPICS